MSGIVGIINLDGAPVDRELLWRMTEFMSFRGPDAQEIWVDGNVGFGHTMLRTTFESKTEKQPLSLDGEVWLTADARIDGRDELISKLKAKGRYDVTSANDAELILHAYHVWGEHCVEHLIGDFAFGIWDSQQRQLFCARDHLGVRPFYYAHLGDSVIFSNTLNCVRRHSAVSEELNEVAIGDFLLFGQNQDSATTSFRDIRRLPSAGKLTVSASLSLTRYWTASPSRQIKYSNPAEYVEHFRDLLSQAVDDRLRTNRVAVSMSGGLDSTTVAAVAQDLLRQRSATPELQAFSVVYDRLIPDEERYYSTLAACAIGIPVTHLAADDYALYQERSPEDFDKPEPFHVEPTSALSNHLLSLLANCSRVGLTGWDGDTFMNEPLHSHFGALVKNLDFTQLASEMWWFAWRGQLPRIGFRTRLKRLVGKYPPKPLYPEWLNQSFSKKLALPERWKQANAEPVNAHPIRPYALRVIDSASWSDLFEGYDAGITRLPLEMRHPIIDVRLVDYLLAIPLVPWCVNKEILKVAMKDKLPRRVLNRPKAPLVGDPALSLVKKSRRWLDEFKPTPMLKSYVEPGACPRLAGEQNSDRLWTNLRPFGLNHWLMHSLPIKQKPKVRNGSQFQYEQKRAKQEAISHSARIIYGSVREITKNAGNAGNLDGGTQRSQP